MRVGRNGLRALVRTLWVAALLTVAVGCTPAAVRAPAPPAGPIEASAEPNWQSGGMVAAANPLAAEAGAEILRAGGSAVDAAVAVQAVLSLVEPQSSGIGGGAFLVHYSAATGDVITYDGREVAPRGATADMFLDASGKPLRFFDAVRSGRSVGVPGAVAMLELAHSEHGRLPWRELWRPGITLAETGFDVSPRLHEMITAVVARGSLPANSAAYLTLDGKTPRPVGSLLRNPDYAATLRRIAVQGARALSEGPIAEEIVSAVRADPLPGTLTLEDLRDYRPNRLEPVCSTYRVYRVCGMRPPSSGGVAVLSVLGILSHVDMAERGPQTVAGWHYLIEAQRLAYADRDTYVADDRYEAVPIAGLLDP